MAELIDPQIAGNLRALFPNEKIDFAVKAKRKIPLVLGVLMLIVSLVFVTVILAFGGTLTNYIFVGESINFDLGLPRSLVIVIFALLFILAIIVMIDSLKAIFWNQVWFVGTDKRIALLQKQKVNSVPWKHFHESISRTSDGKKGTVELTPKPDDVVKPIVVTDVANCDAIQQVCEKRIIEAATVGGNA